MWCYVLLALKEMAVDREARDALANLIRALQRKLIGPTEFEELARLHSRDRAISAIRWAFWSWCDGFKDADYIASDIAHADQGLDRMFRYSLSFLESDREYEWPRWRMLLPLPFRNIALGVRRWEFEYWPFRNRDDLAETAST